MLILTAAAVAFNARVHRVRMRGRIALDFSSGLAEVTHPTTGIATFTYPLTWLGESEYYLREVMGPDVVVPPWIGNNPQRVIRVRHTSEDACDETFIRSGFGAPCVSGEHPGIWHASYARLPTCGFVGTSYELRPSRNGKGPCPYVPTIMHDPVIAQSILDGNLESSLAYNYGLEWAPEGSDYDARHILAGGEGLINHLLVDIPPGRSRGGVRAGRAMDGPQGGGGTCAWWDLGRESSLRRSLVANANTGTMSAATRYHQNGAPHMKRQPLLPYAALALGLAKDTTTAKDVALELPDDAAAALAQVMPHFATLQTALETAMTANGEMATKLGEAEAAVTEGAAEVADLKAQVAAADAITVRDAVQCAALLGVAIPLAADGSPTPIACKDKDGKDATRARTTIDVQTEVVLAKSGRTTYDSLPEAHRYGYVLGSWERLRGGLQGKSSTPATSIPGGSGGAHDAAPPPSQGFAKLLHRPGRTGRGDTVNTSRAKA